jgi:hypothetical protein
LWMREKSKNMRAWSDFSFRNSYGNSKLCINSQTLFFI